MSEELQVIASELADLRSLRDRVRGLSDTADRLLMIEDQALPVNVRRLLVELREVGS